MYVEMNDVSPGTVDRLLFTELKTPVMFRCDSQDCELYSVPIAHKRASIDNGGNTPIIQNWVLEIRGTSTFLWTHCGLISGEVFPEYSGMVRKIFWKIQHQGLLNLVDIVNLAASFGIYEYAKIRRIANMAIAGGMSCMDFMHI